MTHLGGIDEEAGQVLLLISEFSFCWGWLLPSEEDDDDSFDVIDSTSSC